MNSHTLYGGASMNAPGFGTFGTMANIANYRASEDWWFILPAILFVDVVIIFLARFFPAFFGKPINDWYDEFGLAAVLSDVGIIAIGIAITRYVYSAFFLEKDGWSLWYFIALALVIQLIHDVAFAYGVVEKIPQGHNSMIDLFKDYIKAGPAILVTDSIMVGSSIALAAAMKNMDFHYTVSGFLVTAYALSYILFTNVRSYK
jgi:hypothetical protein